MASYGTARLIEQNTLDNMRKLLSEKQFEALLALMGRREHAADLHRAMRDVLVLGFAVTVAASAHGVSQSALSNALARARRKICLAQQLAGLHQKEEEYGF